MKLKTQLILLVTVLCLASCDKKDEPEVINHAQDIAGVYNGGLTISVGETPMDPVENSKVTIKSQQDGKAEITLAGFGEGRMKFQDVVIKDVAVTKDNNTYSLKGNIDVMSGTTNVTGKVEGTVIKGGKANITFSLQPGGMPMSIDAVFTGEK